MAQVSGLADKTEDVESWQRRDDCRLVGGIWEYATRESRGQIAEGNAQPRLYTDARSRPKEPAAETKGWGFPQADNH